MRLDLLIGLFVFYGVPLVLLLVLALWQRERLARVFERVKRYFRDWGERDRRIEEIQRKNAEEEAHWRKVAEAEVKKMTDPDDDEGEVKQSQ